MCANEPIALLQRAERCLPLGLQAAALIRGPAWLDCALEREYLPAVLRSLGARLAKGLLLWTPERSAPLASLARRRVLTGLSTGFIDLSQSPAALEARLAGKWRNMLRRAREANLRLASVSGGAALDWLITRHEAHRRKVGYRSPSPSFYRALAAASRPQDVLVLVAQRGSERIAGVWMQRHGTNATYLLGVTTESGRRWRAHHLLLFEAMLRLRERGGLGLDLGGIDTVGAPGVARFKLGTGCTVVTLAGTYLLTPRRLALRAAPAGAPGAEASGWPAACAFPPCRFRLPALTRRFLLPR